MLKHGLDDLFGKGTRHSRGANKDIGPDGLDNGIQVSILVFPFRAVLDEAFLGIGSLGFGGEKSGLVNKPGG